ncbi:sulfotransferase family protein [Ruegeria lacuscaerulensis]|uniref:sulfotransferase family protein n=1 Tax=Ruegeria lacuscaerulensis TaxID=55218 RepID=UPI00147ED112|nr:sulfotransferase family protein [Ruegeria lacuscaerulensis]
MTPIEKKQNVKKRTFENFIFLEEQNIVFGYVPKVACTNWKVLIRRLQGHSDYENKQIAHDRKKSGFRFLDRTSEADTKILMDNDVQKIAFVRNPYSRVLSAYLDKIDRINKNKNNANSNDFFVSIYNDIINFRESSERNSFAQKVLDRFNHSEGRPIDFLTFLQWIKANQSHSWIAQDEHWAPQSDILRYPTIKIDFLGRFENLGKDAEIALRMMGADFGFPSQNEIGFKATRATSQLKEFYSDAHIELVNELYSSDFDAYGYSRGEIDYITR